MRWWCAGASVAWGMRMRSGVWLRVAGSMPEKFIDRALAAGVRIRECRRCGDRHMELCVPLQDAAKVRELAEKYGVEWEDMGCCGADGLAQRLLRRRTALAGVVALLAVTALLLSRIWMVDVLAADTADEALLARVRQIVAESGVVPGVSAWSVDRALLRSRIISAVPEASYVAVKRKGVQLVVEISQAVEPPMTYDIGAARDICAMYDGVVQRVDVYAGTAAVQPGDTVRRGDVLIYGQERGSDGIAVPVAAEGVVMARIWRKTQAQEPVFDDVLTPTGQQSVSEEIRLWQWSMPVRTGERYALETQRQEFLPVGGAFVPVGILRTTHMECVLQKTARDEEAVKRLLLDKAWVILEENMPFDARVIDKWADYSMIDSENLYVEVTCELEADIAAAGRAEQ